MIPTAHISLSGGDRVNYPHDCGTPTADLLTVKFLLNSVISTPGDKFVTIDIKDFYLNTPMPRYEYMRLKLSDLPDDFIKQYNLAAKVTKDGYVYVEIRRGMYRLPQSGLLAQQLLEKRLNAEGYHQSELTPGFWTHDWRLVSFSLCVGDFGVKYTGKQHADNLMSILKQTLQYFPRLGGKTLPRFGSRLGLHKTSSPSLHAKLCCRCHQTFPPQATTQASRPTLPPCQTKQWSK